MTEEDLHFVRLNARLMLDHAASAKDVKLAVLILLTLDELRAAEENLSKGYKVVPPSD
jgi:hypothetical protein